ncbi:metallophosphoesterase family protein [Aliiroseovarius sp. KMU-50]|uniref:Metallophosphoesterase family protein n=2 Tax=Aliiroseovarius salicola TaxID=3009082 RepID=A0ABT4VXX2_9RHOB|nr:metallophosphoesterase family protein [Aliiroseovarius sp. KMU-50]MDA5093066.1 metallophosphoesterase family protein [Aliiroseovarius sp. KMU-50]
MFRTLFIRAKSYLRRAGPRFEGQPPKPDHPLAVIGDLHGQAVGLERMLARLSDQASNHHWIFLGDYVDRGPHSKDVLLRLHELCQTRPNTTCLIGNHEEMLLRFLDEPDADKLLAHGPKWQHVGGAQTLESFGVILPTPKSGNGSLEQAQVQSQLRDAIPPDIQKWLRQLPRKFVSGNVATVHAGADPSLPIEEQPHMTLTCGHHSFGVQARTDGMWVVHGHTVVPVPREENGVISIDTGAFRNGRLTTALIADGMIEYIQVDCEDS